MGKIHGVGVGPGAVDLLSVRAEKLVREAKYIAFFRKAGRAGHARQIASTLLSKDVIELAMEYPITTEIPLSDQRYSEVLSEFYKKYSNKIISLSQTGIDLVILCEGDPFFYGSFMHIYDRLRTDCPTEVVPAITGMSGAWAATGQPAMAFSHCARVTGRRASLRFSNQSRTRPNMVFLAWRRERKACRFCQPDAKRFRYPP
mgnify:CR=1 FL=1